VNTFSDSENLDFCSMAQPSCSSSGHCKLGFFVAAQPLAFHGLLLTTLQEFEALSRPELDLRSQRLSGFSGIYPLLLLPPNMSACSDVFDLIDVEHIYRNCIRQNKSTLAAIPRSLASCVFLILLTVGS
jgi:hypothetical protein